MIGWITRFKDWIVTPRRKITNLAVGLGHAGGALSCWVLAEATFARWSPNAWVFASFVTMAMIAGLSVYDLKRYPNSQLDTALDALEYSAFVILLVPVFTPIAAAGWLVAVFGTVQIVRYNTGT